MTLIQELNKLVENGVKIRDIESAVNFPKNQLSAILKKHRKLPKKWEDILAAYVSLQDFNKRHTIELPKDFIGVEKIGIIRADGTIEELKTVDQLPPEWATRFMMVQTAAIEMKVAENNKPENKERIEKERNTVSEVSENGQHKQPLTEVECTPNPPTTLDEQELKKQIEAIRAEKIPEHRNRSTLGKKSWEAEQKQRILEIQEQINSLK